MNPVAARVGGTVLEVKVRENERVQAGQILILLDPREVDAARAKAQGALEEALAATALAEAQIDQARAQVRAAASQRDLAELERGHLENLAVSRSIAHQKLEQGRTACQVAAAQLEAATRQVAALQGALRVSAGKTHQARAALEHLELQRSFCTVTAPCEGEVARRSAEKGMVVGAGLPLLALVGREATELYVEANFKETQLARVRPGQRALLHVDLDGRELEGEVESLASGTGSAFSLLPAANATGNWVKVVQRVPVRIRLAPGADPDHRLRQGLSVTACIDTRTGRP
jgi:membrane fusion protein (multidrug efflux system)